MKSIFARIGQQLQRVYRLTFHPDLDSALYLNRTRLNIAAFSMLVLDAIYALLWLTIFKEVQASPYVLIMAASASALAFLNLQWRFGDFLPPLHYLHLILSALLIPVQQKQFYWLFLNTLPAIV